MAQRRFTSIFTTYTHRTSLIICLWMSDYWRSSEFFEEKKKHLQAATTATTVCILRKRQPFLMEQLLSRRWLNRTTFQDILNVFFPFHYIVRFVDSMHLHRFNEVVITVAWNRNSWCNSWQLRVFFLNKFYFCLLRICSFALWWKI